MVRALASYQCCPGSNPGIDAICGLSLLLVLSFALRGFSPGTPVSPLSSKTNISKFQFAQESGRRRTTLWMCYLQIIIYLFIYLFIKSKDRSTALQKFLAWVRLHLSCRLIQGSHSLEKPLNFMGSP